MVTEDSGYSVNSWSKIADSPLGDWQSWLTEQQIFNQSAFVGAMEQANCVTSQTGWQPAHLGLYQSQQLKAFIPLYIKNHSYGEYMFDWQWVNGFHRAGIQYYPKAVSAIPFTPVTGSRLIHRESDPVLYRSVLDYVSDMPVSNFQCLYVTRDEADAWQQAGAMIRKGYQFSWYNDSYQDFDDFLSRLKSSARKKIRQERRKLATSKLTFRRCQGEQISREDWDFFQVCYQRTYLKRSGHEGYLNKAFYDQIYRHMRDNLLLIVADYEGKQLAASLCFIGGDTLYGRYWGTLQDVDSLHFEVCYYQGIEYCIEHGLRCYQPGTQGHYKRRRGFVPEFTYGIYHFNAEAIRPAIEEFLSHESRELDYQFQDWLNSSPYKKN